MDSRVTQGRKGLSASPEEVAEIEMKHKEKKMQKLFSLMDAWSRS